MKAGDMKLVDRLALGKKKSTFKDTDVLRKIRVSIPAQGASLTPPLGPALGQFGINIVEFCKQFNERTRFLSPEVMLLADITLKRNKSFRFHLVLPSTGFLVNEANEFLEDEEVPSLLKMSDFYKIVRYKGIYEYQDEFSLACTVKASLDSMGIIILDDSEIYK
jgi:ribosomal protein L11